MFTAFLRVKDNESKIAGRRTPKALAGKARERDGIYG